jgi:hypothetical protein
MHGYVEELFPLMPSWKTNHTMGWGICIFAYEFFGQENFHY